ncbi:DUF4232 domain-containing protein [Catenulispora sp. NF23]|uniref:DUF4232 domain-containing protein n=1 Tax=Catenulispora pinistramenti TaxID=2705254 RepID=UPI001BAB5819|nr:DUF4232 domain-containing protein [Catenulispora pinistramenti]MBS2539564.1 DUF4232 domain-containing protein [Catenulispora pinistramenti]
MSISDSSHRIGIRLGAAVVVSLTAVALTAGCSSSKSSKAASTAPPPAATTTVTAAATSSSSGTVDGGASPSTTGSSSESAKPTTVGAGGPHDCSADMLSLSIAPLREPINHVMISAKNTSQLPCHLNQYPELRITPGQNSIITPLDTSKPAQPTILLAPGATAYAGLMTNSPDGSGKNGKNVPSLTLSLESSSPQGGGVGRPVTVAMPASADYIDSSAFVTYWQSDLQTAASS